MKIKRIAIVGGGTAGWLAASHLGAELSADKELEITVIESADVPTIGVGEGTVPYIMNGLKRFGISEAELILSCDVTFKQGIKFVNWLNPNIHGEGNYYYHPFDVPYPAGFDVTPYWVSHAKNLPFDYVGIQSRICELGLSPKKISSEQYSGVLNYAYHFNATKFFKLLSKNAQEKFNVVHKVATIVGADKDDSGNIMNLIADTGEKFAFDFYVDCSGFSSLLLGKELGVPFISKATELFIDTALVQQVPLDGQEELNPYTTATAHKAGWIWDIPLTTRRGTGFVYSSNYMEHEEALSLYANYLGIPPDSFLPRKIPMNVGYRKNFWSNNCVALGLAQGFVEPLEATSILVADFSAELLVRNFPRHSEDIATLTPYYNKVVTHVWDRVIDFIKLHYFISDRNDSPFWLDNQSSEGLSETLRERLEIWKIRPPQKSDFFSRFDLFGADNFLYVLYGMKYKTRELIITPGEINRSRRLIEENESLVEKSASMLLKQKDWLMRLNAAVSRV
ncbi:MAG: tryptophan halogenase [Cellvibrio sp. 79]|nr:MAG: tryptophan halogenase [Cellvibrio sp. 79]